MRTVVDAFHAPGTYARTLEAGSMGPGTYFCRLESEGRTLQRAIEVMR